ncbi:MAG: hypothetical protein OXD50_07590 [Chloroflexi bacterium]|nr:hypothetical protein [Chloroflexota bacterium]
MLDQLGSIFGRPQLIIDRAYEAYEMRVLAVQLGWELITPPKAKRRKL